MTFHRTTVMRLPKFMHALQNQMHTLQRAMSALFCPGTGASEVLAVYGTWPIASWNKYPTAVYAMARGLCTPICGRRWIVLTTSAAVFDSSTLLGVSRPQSYGPQVLLCQMRGILLCDTKLSLFLCPVIPLLPFLSPRIIQLLQSTFWVPRGADRQPKGGTSLQMPMGGLQDLLQDAGSNLRDCCSHPVYLPALPCLQDQRGCRCALSDGHLWQHSFS